MPTDRLGATLSTKIILYSAYPVSAVRIHLFRQNGTSPLPHIRPHLIQYNHPLKMH